MYETLRLLIYVLFRFLSKDAAHILHGEANIESNNIHHEQDGGREQLDECHEEVDENHHDELG